MNPLLDNPFWNALAGAQARHACGTDGARRFARGFSPILAFADAEQPSFAGLDAFCSAGERFHCDAWPGAAPAGWRIEHEAPISQMVWHASLPPLAANESAAVQLGAGSADLMLELADATRPGPFGPRTPELGEYWGIFDGERLVAMAGERLHLPGFREISGVCTRAGYTGRGYARQLVALLVARQLARGETPFLHVARDNRRARDLYTHLGFAQRRETAVRVLVNIN